jgi:tartrate-resistant acid phosphatase type 5
MSSSRASCEALECRRLLATNGLNAVYFNNSDYTGPSASRVDAGINLALPSLHSSPASKIDGKTFSARWHGLVKPYSTETYTFITKNTDGVRLWVNGKLLIDSWKAGPTKAHAGTIALKKNRLYDLRLEYYNGRHAAKMILAWDTPSRAAALVPASRLFAYDTRGASVGDFGKDNAAEASVAKMIRGWKPAYVTTVGDNNYPDGASATIDRNIGKHYATYIGNYHGSYGPGPSTNAFFPALGNHDWNTAGAKPYFDYLTLPGNERYYDFVKGSIHFFVLDSDPHEPDGTSASSTQAQWLKSKLASSSEPFNVVYFHHAPYSSGPEGSEHAMRWPFRDWGADVVLSGHNHQYERLSVDGVPYIVNGAGSETKEFDDVRPESVARANDDCGALLIQANEFAMTLQYQYDNGHVMDTLTIGPTA